MSGRAPDLADLTVLRHVPGSSVVHRLGALSKIVVLASLTIALAARASWWAVAVAGGVAIGGFVLARLPLGVLPRPPRVLWWALGASAALAVVAGGEPEVDLLGVELGLGGLEAFLRFLALTVVVLGLAGLVGWTTPAADLTPAIATILRPFRRLGLPVEELVAALALAVRVLPMLIDELRTVALVLRQRDPDDRRSVTAVLLDVMATVVTVSVRRAGELGDALVARGGIRAPYRRPRLRVGDVVVMTTAIATAIAIVVWA
jgi:energy-coupling factor transport system permease protein